ncbi:hypothetical protein EGW08_005566 [Elysia chlorotica]|uniref:C-type lectin domain-containing protein n=1 Tax=Elysia chlorotica TaxID=188477 RepID=A0A3S1BET5_ELYCH|nr:hypothetical protein EGW08_005566 [Elysia chlorotica]
MLASTSPQVTLVALGLRWSENYKQFVWADSEEAMFTNWAEDEPNMRRGLCAEMIVAGNSPGQWLTVSCHRPINFVCEKSQGSNPNASCKAGTYGPGCKINCSENCAGPDNACNYTDGACLLGCDDGFKGDTCNLAALQATADKEDPQGDDSFWNHYTTVLAVAMGLVASMFFTIVLTLRGDNIPVTPAQRRQSGAAASFSLEEGVTTGYRAQLAAIEEDAHDEDEAEDEDTNGGRNKTLNKKKEYNGSMAESSGPLADYSNGADA